jgi:phage terminase large subunit
MAEQALKIKNTTATEKVFALKKRIRAVAGGTSASKTISILIWCIDYGQSVPDEMISVVSESYPHLEKGAILDFQMIMKDRGYWDDTRWHDTKHTYTFETGTRLEFFSPDAYGKVHGPRRDVLFANEANHLDFRIIDQLITRTARSCGSTGIPRRSFGSTPRCVPSAVTSTITLTYKDNEALDAQTIAEIESHRDNKAWWSVYGEGKLGVIESRIYRDWRLDLDEIPHEARLERYGLDFGYSNDPTAIVAVYELNGGYILDEVAYTKGLSNKATSCLICPVRWW